MFGGARRRKNPNGKSFGHNIRLVVAVYLTVFSSSFLPRHVLRVIMLHMQVCSSVATSIVGFRSATWSMLRSYASTDEKDLADTVVLRIRITSLSCRRNRVTICSCLHVFKCGLVD